MQFDTFSSFWLGLCILALALALIYFARKYPATAHHAAPSPPSHPCQTFHWFQLISCQPGLSGLGNAITFELRACRLCGQHAVTVLPGNWSLEDLHKNQNEIALLERMAKL